MFAGPPLLSAHWFPATQRVTATAVAVMAYYLGIATAFVLGKSHAISEFVFIGFGIWVMGLLVLLLIACFSSNLS